MFQQTQQSAGKAIFNNLKPLAAVRILEKTGQSSIIYPLRKPKPPQQPAQGMFRIPPSKGELFFDPVNHEGGKPSCMINMLDYPSDGKCAKCQKIFPIKDWYYDLTLAMVIMYFKNNQNKRDIIECVKFYSDGEYEILYTEYDEAVETDKYLDNDPIIDGLIEVQREIVNRVGTNENVILEQSPELVEEFTKIIDQALQ